jgi:hypothetical protein
VAVAVVLAASGVTVVLLNGEDAKKGTRTSADAPGGGTPSPGRSRGTVDLSDDETAKDKGKGNDDKDVKAPPSSGGKDEQVDDEEPDASATPSKNGSGGTTGGSGGTETSGGTTGGGTTGGSTGGATEEEPVCHAIGGGKYNCTVWTTAKSYDAAGTEVGILKQGTNYFYCQQNLGRRETSGRWTNVWWARTDDDSGNRNVFVSVVYVQGGDNDAPVPGLPHC